MANTQRYNINKNHRVKKNKNHKQRYFKRENKKINKENLIEVKGDRTELKPFYGKKIKIECFVTNTYAFSGSKRLLNSCRILGTNLYVSHLWVNEEQLAKAHHGYIVLEAKVKRYKNKYTDTNKYGIKVTDKRFYRKKENKIKKLKWDKVTAIKEI